MFRICSAAAAFVALLVSSVANADLSYRLNAHLDGAGNGERPDLSADVSIQGQMIRYDSTISFAGTTFHIVNIADGAAGKLYSLDPALKIYTVQDAFAVRSFPLGIGTMVPCYTAGGEGLLLPLPNGVVGGPAVPITVVDHGMEKVGRAQGHHWTISWPATAGELFDSIEVWTDDTAAQPVDAVTTAALNGTGYSGDVEKLKAVLSAEPLKIQVPLMTPATAPPAQGPGTVTYQTSRISDRGVDSALFVVPGGVQQVTPDQFVAQEHDASGPRLSGNPAPQPINSNGPNQDDGGPDNPGAAPTAPPTMPAPD